jgi:hypothetical protein
MGWRLRILDLLQLCYPTVRAWAQMATLRSDRQWALNEQLRVGSATTSGAARMRRERRRAGTPDHPIDEIRPSRTCHRIRRKPAVGGKADIRLEDGHGVMTLSTPSAECSIGCMRHRLLLSHRKARIAFYAEAAQREVPKSHCCTTGSQDAIGGRSSFITQSFSYSALPSGTCVVRNAACRL